MPQGEISKTITEEREVDQSMRPVKSESQVNMHNSTENTQMNKWDEQAKLETLLKMNVQLLARRKQKDKT